MYLKEHEENEGRYFSEYRRRRLGEGDGGGSVSRNTKSCRERPPRNGIFTENFLNTQQSFIFSNVSKIKWHKKEEKSDFRGRWFECSWVHPPLPHVKSSWQRPCRTHTPTNLIQIQRGIGWSVIHERFWILMLKLRLFVNILWRWFASKRVRIFFGHIFSKNFIR